MLADVAVPILGFLTEPISREAGGAAALHWDLEQRRRAMARLDRANVDRLVSFDPLIVADRRRGDGRSGARCRSPSPIASTAPCSPSTARRGCSSSAAPPCIASATCSTSSTASTACTSRSAIQVQELEGLLDRHQITFNIHNEPYPSFENRVLLHLAAGHLVISEPLSPTHGLVAGADFVEIDSPEELLAAATAARATPEAFHDVRVSGRQKVEQMRASRVWPALVADLFADLQASGTHRDVALPDGQLVAR